MKVESALPFKSQRDTRTLDALEGHHGMVAPAREKKRGFGGVGWTGTEFGKLDTHS